MIMLRGWVLLGIATVAAFPAGADGAEHPSPLVVVVSKQLDLRGLSSAELRRLFRGEPIFVHDIRLVPLNPPPGDAARDEFDRLVLEMSPSQVGRYWLDRKIRSGSPPPRTVPSPALALALVARVPGLVAYVRQVEVAGEVRVLAIDDRAPGSPGYPLAGARD